MMEARARFERLVEAGAKAFDDASVRYVATLLARAEGEVLEGVKARLVIRASERLERLAASMAAAREEALSVLSSLELVDAEGGRELRELLARGDFREAMRLGRAKLRGCDPEASPRLLARLSRTEEQARAHGIRLPAELRARVDALRTTEAPLGSQAVRTGNALAYELSTALLDAVLSRSRGSLSYSRIARRQNTSEQVGPYNPRAVATRTLERMGRLAPGYLQVWFDVLGDMAALERLVPPPVQAGRKKK